MNMQIKLDISHEKIEQITSERLCKLNLEESNFYDLDFIDELEENDEIMPCESGFMMGYLSA